MGALVNNMNQQAPQSYIQIVFQDIGSTIFNMNVDGVTPLQFLAVAEYFRIYGEMLVMKQQAKEAAEAQRNKIAVPDGILVK